MRPPRHPDRARLIERHPDQAVALRRLANVGPATAEDLLLLGVHTVEELARQDPDDMYARICLLDGVRHDACVRDVYRAIVDQAKGLPPRPWFEYTRARKLRERAEARLRQT